MSSPPIVRRDPVRTAVPGFPGVAGVADRPGIEPGSIGGSARAAGPSWATVLIGLAIVRHNQSC
ncbi:hypothetical protein YT1_4634 [Rhodococcus ruber]|nr:hypothetical protein YT1_4634 [Rhodococcus ruber]